MLDVEGLSTEAKIGKILILVSLILGIVGVLGMLVGFTSVALFPLRYMRFPIFAGFFFVIAAVVKILGLIIGFMALSSTTLKNFNKAGMYAIISSLLPPLDLIMLIGGILCLISKEAK
ncbi:MAG: hypothetical protein APG12_00806 [Candidatus Methanofastidiosum methylothiophilum]|uniref:Uncharacterized protein n=1 Tax=Candidatus Methanofastidiosum methylothiophilum TaxID=1705564 RepID=A0A150ILD4_9EURY|nr:MAG: hypothetical protein APG10_00534 [Candidatus Methanofastidiosum methylthiophilus]KYC48083.1 MAG: hypothetical protein APG11_00653 [Candidatus Methanofastidiosum methylthiophilus]KYC50474.1 MAG: hypothetical protein APG12_00806 [Candidatus Methanofastidiosum methylthiophilus]